MHKELNCAWCHRTFLPRTNGGKAQRFCSEPCRRSLDREARAVGRHTLREGAGAPRAFVLAGSSTGLGPTGHRHPALASGPENGQAAPNGTVDGFPGPEVLPDTVKEGRST